MQKNVITLSFLSIFIMACATIKIPLQSHPTTKNWTSLIKSDFSNAINPDGVWSISDGVLTASEDKNIWTKKTYDNFVLDLEFKTDAGTNSGVIVYCSNNDKWIPNSVEIQIADDYAKKWANSPKNWQCGAIFGHLAASKRMVKPAGQWNKMTITCKDKMVYVLLNGVETTVMDMDLWTSATTNPDGSEIPSWLSTPFNQLPTKGSIGLQGKHAGAPIYFRNLRVKEL